MQRGAILVLRNAPTIKITLWGHCRPENALFLCAIYPRKRYTFTPMVGPYAVNIPPVCPNVISHIPSYMHSTLFYYGFRGILGYTPLLLLSPQKESRKSLKNKHLRLFLCPEKCTENAPSFLPTSEKSLFEGVPMGFYPIFTGAGLVYYSSFLTAVLTH